VTRIIDVFVPGVPLPQGSMVGIYSPAAGRVIMKHDRKGLIRWRRDIGWMVRGAMNAAGITTADRDHPVSLRLVFRQPIDVDQLPERMIVVPDIDKLARAVLDACKGVLYTDDQQVYSLKAEKVAATPAQAGVSINAWIEDRLVAIPVRERPDARRRENSTRRARTAGDNEHL
jgi:Holliday junction resolvase RusA-like endonuclease